MAEVYDETKTINVIYRKGVESSATANFIWDYIKVKETSVPLKKQGSCSISSVVLSSTKLSAK